MKKGINIWSFPEGKPIEDCMRTAKEAGFDGIELAMERSGELSLDSGERDVRRIAERAEKIGIEICGLASGLYWSYSFTSGAADNRRQAFAIASKQLEIASWLGVDTALVIPGAVGADFIPNSEIVPYDAAYERASDAVRRLAATAERHRVGIGLENVWNKFLLSPLEFRDFIDSAESEYVGAYFDVGNTVATGYPEHWISILNRRIRQVHLKDYRRQAGGLHGFVDLLAGDVDFPSVMRQLRAVGYDGYVVAEMLPPYRHSPEQIVWNTSKSMDRILEMKGEEQG